MNVAKRMSKNNLSEIERGLTEEEFDEINRLLKTIPKEFFDPNFNVLKKVVEIQSSPTRIKDVQQIEERLRTIEHALFKIVDVYYSGFHLSTKSHSLILEKLQQNKKKVKLLKQNFTACKQLIDQNYLHLSTIWKLSNQYEEIISLIDCIIWLKSVPIQLEKYLGKTNYRLIDEDTQNSNKNNSNNNNINNSNNNNSSINNKEKDKIRAEKKAKKQLKISTQQKYYLHSAVLLSSAAILLTSPYPKLNTNNDQFIVNLSREEIKRSYQQSSVVNPFEKIPATSSLRSSLLSRRNVRFLIYF